MAKAAARSGFWATALLVAAAAIPAQPSAAHLPSLLLGPEGELGPPDSQAILATALRGEPPLVIRSQDNRSELAAYQVIASSPGDSEDSASDSQRSFLKDPGDRPARAGKVRPGAGLASGSTVPPLWVQKVCPVDLAGAGSAKQALLAFATSEADGYRVYARTLESASHVVVPGPESLVEVGPAAVGHLRVALAPGSRGLVAWDSQLAGRPQAIRYRLFGSEGAIGPARLVAEPGLGLTGPEVALSPAGFLLAYLRQFPRVKTDRNAPSFTPEGSGEPAELEGHGPAWGRTVDDARGSRLREVLTLPLDPDGLHRSLPQVGALGPELDHLKVLGHREQSVFWTDPRGGGRELHFRSVDAGGWRGQVHQLRTDLRSDLAEPFELASVADGLYLVVWSQRVGDGRSMVIEARLFHSTGLAASAPAVVAIAADTLDLRSLVAASNDTWIAVWDQFGGSVHRLRDRCLKVG